MTGSSSGVAFFPMTGYNTQIDAVNAPGLVFSSNAPPTAQSAA
jgi:hypothetical protein